MPAIKHRIRVIDEPITQIYIPGIIYTQVVFDREMTVPENEVINRLRFQHIKRMLDKPFPFQAKEFFIYLRMMPART